MDIGGGWISGILARVLPPPNGFNLFTTLTSIRLRFMWNTIIIGQIIKTSPARVVGRVFRFSQREGPNPRDTRADESLVQKCKDGEFASSAAAEFLTSPSAFSKHPNASIMSLIKQQFWRSPSRTRSMHTHVNTRLPPLLSLAFSLNLSLYHPKCAKNTPYDYNITLCTFVVTAYARINIYVHALCHPPAAKVSF